LQAQFLGSGKGENRSNKKHLPYYHFQRHKPGDAVVKTTLGKQRVKVEGFIVSFL